METRKLGNTNIKVSKICLGTMTWGQQNTKEEAFEQMDYALSCGVNFFDTAELYSVPPKIETYGITETIIGEWFKKRNNRDKVILASKMAGPGPSWIRKGKGLVSRHIQEAIDNSLKRLQTDYIDLYQLHWPQRKVPLWGKLNFHESMYDNKTKDNILEFYEALATVRKSGKIRHLGLSNETSWGAMTYASMEREYNLPKMQSIQNSYSLIRRIYETGLSEISMHENMGLLAYSPLSGGLLSGKYQNNSRPENSRFTIFPQMFAYYNNEKIDYAIREYEKIAKEHNMNLATLALAFVNDRGFVTSNIIGATTMEQLKENIASADVKLSEEIFKKIEEVHDKYPNPGNF